MEFRERSFEDIEAVPAGSGRTEHRDDVFGELAVEQVPLVGVECEGIEIDDLDDLGFASLVMRVVLIFERAAWSELKHPNLSDSYDYTLGLLACQDSMFPHLKCTEVSMIPLNRNVTGGEHGWPRRMR